MPYYDTTVQGQAINLVNEKFEVAQNYADEAFADAQAFLTAITGEIATIEPISTTVDFDYQTLNLSTLLEGLRPEVPVIDPNYPSPPAVPVLNIPAIGDIGDIPEFNVPAVDVLFPETPTATLPA